MKKASKTFQDLIVWQKAHQFVLEIYSLTKQFPKKQMYGLSFQFRRAATSIPTNIAEGFKKQDTLDKARFMNIAQGSVEECGYYLILNDDLKYGKTRKLNLLLQEVSKLLNAYRQAILDSES